jgi:hypothetical protein
MSVLGNESHVSLFPLSSFLGQPQFLRPTRCRSVKWSYSGSWLHRKGDVVEKYKIL